MITRCFCRAIMVITGFVGTLLKDSTVLFQLRGVPMASSIGQEDSGRLAFSRRSSQRKSSTKTKPQSRCSRSAAILPRRAARSPCQSPDLVHLSSIRATWSLSKNLDPSVGLRDVCFQECVHSYAGSWVPSLAGSGWHGGASVGLGPHPRPSVLSSVWM